MRDIWENIKDFFVRDWTPAEKILVILCCLLLGIIKGFLISPVKRGLFCGNNSGNTYNRFDDGYWLDEEE